ncbi:MAG: hypothetical protein EPN47_19815 [Acidobacteria bacterium]|nr:MAG: hypothetical protein EPN47_19815 [Acidobacteriota bacterium]
MAIHANIVSQPAGKVRRIYDASVNVAGQGFRLPSLFDVKRPRPMAVFTPNCQLFERRVLILAFYFLVRLRPSAMADDAVSRNRAIKPVFCVFVSRRKVPPVSTCVVGDRGLEQEVPSPNDAAKAVRPRPDNPVNFVISPEDNFVALIKPELPLI